MPKEYDDIKKQYIEKNPKWDDSKVSEVASKVFYDIFNITVKEAIKLESEGKWNSYLKEHSGKGAKSYFRKSQYVDSELNLIKDESGLYLEGFVSSEIPDDKSDAVPQEMVRDKINNKKDRLSKMLSDDHNWMNGDESDYKPLGYAQIPCDLRYNPNTGTYDTYVKFKIDETAPRFNIVYNKLKKSRDEKDSYKGFSIEYELFGQEPEIVGNVVANKWTDFNIIGFGLTPEPMNRGATLTRFYAKSYNVIGGKNMDENTPASNEPVPKKEEQNTQDLNSNQNTNNNSSDDIDTTKKYISKLEQEINQMKQENQKVKIEMESKELEIKKKELEKDLEGLTAGKRVLIDNTTEQSVDSQKPATGKDVIKEKLNSIYSNNKITTREKIKQVSDVVIK
jgi:hypothetical protein